MENYIICVFILACTVYIERVQSQACPDGLNVANMCIPGSYTSDRIFIDTTTYNTFVSNCTCSFTTTSNVLKLVTYVAPNYPQCNSAIRLQSESGNNMRFECLISGTYLDTTIYKSGEATFENYANFYDNNYCLMLEVAGQPTDSITVTCSANIPPEFYDTTTEQDPEFMIDPLVNDVTTSSSSPAMNDITLSNIDTTTRQPLMQSSTSSSDAMTSSQYTASNETAVSGLDMFKNDTHTLNVNALVDATKEESQTMPTIEKTTATSQFIISNDKHTVNNLIEANEATLSTTVTPIVKTTFINTDSNTKYATETLTTGSTQTAMEEVTSTPKSNDMAIDFSGVKFDAPVDVIVTNETASVPSENHTKSQYIGLSQIYNKTIVAKSADKSTSADETVVGQTLSGNETLLLDIATMNDTSADDQRVQSMNQSENTTVLEQTTVLNMVVKELPIETNSTIETVNQPEAITLTLQEISENFTIIPAAEVNLSAIDFIIDDNNTIEANNLLNLPDTLIEDLNITTNETITSANEYNNFTDANVTETSSTDAPNIVTTVLKGTILLQSGNDNSSKVIQNINNVTNDLMDNVLNRVETQPNPSTSKYDIIFHSTTRVQSTPETVMEVSSPMSPFKENANTAAITPPMDLSNTLVHEQINPSQNFGTNETEVFDFQGNVDFNFPSTSAFEEAKFENVTFTNNVRLESSPFTANEPRIITENAEPILPIENITITGMDILQANETNATPGVSNVQFAASNPTTVELNIESAADTHTEPTAVHTDGASTTQKSVLVTKSNTQTDKEATSTPVQTTINQMDTSTYVNTEVLQVTTTSADPTIVDKADSTLSQTVSVLDLNNNFQGAETITSTKSQTSDVLNTSASPLINKSTTLPSATPITDNQDPAMSQTVFPFDMNNNFQDASFTVSTEPQSQGSLNRGESSIVTDKTPTPSSVGSNVAEAILVDTSSLESTTESVTTSQTEAAAQITSTLANGIESTENNLVNTNADQIFSASTIGSSQVEKMNSNIPYVEHISFVRPSKSITKAEYEAALNSLQESSTVVSTVTAEVVNNDTPSIESISIVRPSKSITQAEYENMLNSLPETSTVDSTTQTESTNNDTPSIESISIVRPPKSITRAEYENMSQHLRESSTVESTSQADQMNSNVPSVEDVSFVKPSISINQSEYEATVNAPNDSSSAIVDINSGTQNDQSMSMTTESSVSTPIVNGATKSDLIPTTMKALDNVAELTDSSFTEQSISHKVETTASPNKNSDKIATNPTTMTVDINPTVIGETMASDLTINGVTQGFDFGGFVTDAPVKVAQETTNNNINKPTSPSTDNIITEPSNIDDFSFWQGSNLDTNTHIEGSDPLSVGSVTSTSVQQSTTTQSLVQTSTEENLIREEIAPEISNTNNTEMQTTNEPISTEASIVAAEEISQIHNNPTELKLTTQNETVSTEPSIVADEIIPIHNNPSEVTLPTQNEPLSTEPSLVEKVIVPVENNPSESTLPIHNELVPTEPGIFEEVIIPAHRSVSKSVVIPENNDAFDATNILSEIHNLNLQQAGVVRTTDATLVTTDASVTESMAVEGTTMGANLANGKQTSTSDLSSNQQSESTHLDQQITTSETRLDNKSTQLTGSTDKVVSSGRKDVPIAIADVVDKTSEKQLPTKEPSTLAPIDPNNEVALPEEEFNVVQETRVVTDGPTYTGDSKDNANGKEMNISFDRESNELPLDVDNNTYIIVVGTIAGLVVIAVVIVVICRNKNKKQSEKVNISGNGIDPASHQNKAFDNQVEDPEQGTSGQENKPESSPNGEGIPPPPPETIQH